MWVHELLISIEMPLAVWPLLVCCRLLFLNIVVAVAVSVCLVVSLLLLSKFCKGLQELKVEVGSSIDLHGQT